jgi:FMNH2-dependent dimethyl sulfone monooxygenase
VGSSKLVGTPEQVAHSLAQLQEAGLDAVGLTFRHVEEEMAEFIDKVLPLLEQMGVRRPRVQNSLPLSQVAG